MNLLYADLSGPHVPAWQVEVLHSFEGELSQVSVVDARGNQWHWYIPLNTIDTDPWWNERQDFGYKINQRIWIIVLVLARLPQFIEASASNNESRIDLEAIGTEGRVLKILPKALNVPLVSHVRQIRHHVSNHFEAGVLGKVECLFDGGDGVTPVGIPGHILKDALHTHFHSGTSVYKHVFNVLGEAEVGAGFDSNTNTLGLALLGVDDGLRDRVGTVSRKGIMKISDEVVPILLIERHECATHDNKLNLIGIVTESLQLFDSVLGLQVRIVSGSDCAHGCWLVSSVTLRGVLKVGVRTTRTVYADITSGANMRASVRLTHHSDDSDT